MRVRHASPDMTQTPPSPSTLIGDDMPSETHSEMKVPSPSKQHYNSQTSATASLQVPARVTDEAPFPPADMLRLVREQRQRDTRKQSQKLLEDGRRRAIQVLSKPGAWCNLIERRLSLGSRAGLGLRRSIVHSQVTHDLGSRPDGGKIIRLTDSHSLEKNEAVGAVQEKTDSGNVKTLLNPKGHRPKKLIVKLPLKAPLGGKRPLPADEAEEGDKEMAGGTRPINPQKKRRLATPPAQKKVLKLRPWWVHMAGIETDVRRVCR